MTLESQPRPYWVVSVLVTGDDNGATAVSAEGLMKTALLEDPEGARAIVSTVARFEDLSPAEQDQWREVLRRDADDW